MVNDAQVNYAALELPMGGWKASGLGSRHGPDGIRKYTKRQSLLVTPGYAPARDAHHLPYNAEVSAAIGDTFAALATSDLFDDRQRVTLAALCDTFIPSLEPPEGEDDPHGFWARAASHAAIPEGVEVALLAAELPEEQIEGLRDLLDALAESGMAAATPQELREQIVHGFSDQSPEALAGITALRGLAATLFYALPDLGTGRNPTWDAIGYPGPLSPPPDRERPLRMHREPAASETVEADVCVIGSGAGGGVIAGELAAAGKRVVRARDGRLLRRPRLRPARVARLPAALSQRRPVPDRRRPDLDRRRQGGGWRHGRQLDQLPAHPRLGPLRVGGRTRARWARRAGVRRPPRRGQRADPGQRRLQRPERSPPADQGRLRAPRLRLRPDRAQRRPRALRPGERRLHGLRRPVGRQALDRQDLPGRRAATPRPRSWPAAGPSGSWSRTGGPPGSRPSTPTRRRRPAVPSRFGSRSARRPWSSPAARSSRPPCCCARGSAGRRSATSCACTRPPRSPPTTRSRRTGAGARRRRRSRTSSPTPATGTAS